MRLAEILQTERERRGWSLRAVAREMGVAPGTYEGWEKGWREPDRGNYETIARYLMVPMPDLLSYLDLLTPEQAERLGTLAKGVYVSSHRSMVPAA